MSMSFLHKFGGTHGLKDRPGIGLRHCYVATRM